MVSTTKGGKAKMALARDFERAYRRAVHIDESSGKRRSVPVRATFARDLAETRNAPMGKLVAIGGRGGEVPVKLYLALIWRSSAEPFATRLSARWWAELLALPDSSGNGTRRVRDALKTLGDHDLIEVKQRRGIPPVVTLLREDGSGQPYSVPRGANGDYYFQIPAQMWTTGQLQKLSTPGLAMLMAVLAEQTSPGSPVWWSTTRFPGRYGLSSATRARGTKELQEAGLLDVERKLIPLSVDRPRKIYRVTGAALLQPTTAQSHLPGSEKAAAKRPSPVRPAQEEEMQELLDRLSAQSKKAHPRDAGSP
jgi:hypothetical protein